MYINVFRPFFLLYEKRITWIFEQILANETFPDHKSEAASKTNNNSADVHQ